MTAFWSIVQRVASRLIMVATLVFLFAIGFRMTEQFMEQLDGK